MTEREGDPQAQDDLARALGRLYATPEPPGSAGYWELLHARIVTRILAVGDIPRTH